MGEVNVFFWGLICHVNNSVGNVDMSDMAVLVQATGHAPMIVFGEDIADRHKLDIATEVTFKDGYESANINRQQFDRFVPSLKRILGGTLLIPQQKVVYCRYPRAEGPRLPTLTVHDTYPHAANHISKLSNQTKRSEQPVARLIRLRVPRDEAVIVQFTSGGVKKSKSVSSGSCILISNVESTHLAEAAANLLSAGEHLAELVNKAGREDQRSLSYAAQAIDSAAKNFQLLAAQANTDVPNHFEYYSDILVASDTCGAYEGGDAPDSMTAAEVNCDWLPIYVQHVSGLIERSGVRPECGNSVYP